MPGRSGSTMKPISDTHLRLGQALQRAREARGLSTRKVPRPNPQHPYFSSGHISLVENGYTPPSPELIEAYISVAGHGTELRSLYEQMLAVSQEAGRKRRRGDVGESETVPPQHIKDVISREQVQQHYIVEVNDAFYTFNGNGVIEDVRCVITLRAKTPNVRMYYAGHTYAADRRPGVLRVESGTGATLAATRESETGALQSYFVLDRDLSPADPDPYTLSFRLVVNSTVRARPSLTYQSWPRAQQMVLRAQFRKPTLPSRLWWFGAPYVIDAERPQSGCELPVDPGGYYFHPFANLIPHWCYGFAWVW